MALKTNEDYNNNTSLVVGKDTDDNFDAEKPIGSKRINVEGKINEIYVGIENETGDGWMLDTDNVVYGRSIGNDGSITLVPMRANEFGYQIPIQYLHQLVHEGIIEIFSHTFLSVPAGESRAVEIISANGYDTHIPSILYSGELKTRFKSYEGYTLTGTPTAFVTANRIVSGNGVNGTIQTYESNLTINTYAKLRTDEFAGANSVIKAGGSVSDGQETVVTQNDKLIVVVTNAGNNVSDIMVIMNFYERPASITP